MARQELVARSVVRAILAEDSEKSRPLLSRILSAFAAFFSFFDLPLRRLSPELFESLRAEQWETKEDDYAGSFRSAAGVPPEKALEAVGDMGYSGSTFFTTSDKRWLVKSVPRYFEHSFFRDDLLHPYAAHMSSQASSLLVRISDFLASPYYPIGSLLGLAPTHQIIMQNLLHGKESASSSEQTDWETWDLKPTSYFFPERDIAAGKLSSEATKSRLADKFEDRILLSKDQADSFIKQLETDTALLARSNAVDYSLFLVRIKIKGNDPFADPSPSSVAADAMPAEPPFTPPSPPSWRTGIISPDGKHVFRAAVLDFFWAKHKTQPRLMTALINIWNLLISRQGHMSITTDPEEYRERFLKMCKEIIEIAPS